MTILSAKTRKKGARSFHNALKYNRTINTIGYSQTQGTGLDAGQNQKEEKNSMAITGTQDAPLQRCKTLLMR